MNMRMATRPLTLIALCLLTGTSAPAWAIYKCDSQGTATPTYSDKPCAGGKSMDIPASPAPTDINAAKQSAANEQRRLQHLEKERRRQEEKEEKEQRRLQQQAARSHATKQKKCALLARRKQWAEEDTAAATGKSVTKARTKMRRAAEQFSVECGK